ncbi:HupE/UreJ family protein [Paenibacillus prosopidis]|uniref:HupE/UreJ protein n=1 Tax=Paenibacillus prosopidis TaxID=630520 RepID=A0A368WAG5_9BACL|nr:HupE/UreJ family protein [Paenibacillus prosopidis]RCW51698.1 HupE/UreJ protein [Paenibacillus prosopidis]
MPVQWFRKLASLFLIALSLFMVTPVFAHELNMGGSKWSIGKDHILSTIELGPSLFQQIRGIKEFSHDLDSLTDEQLREMATGIIQPYINEKLSVSVNDRSYPLMVDRIEREGTLWKIWLRVNDINFDWQDNKVKIDYRLLFEETKNDHVNIGLIYFSDANDDSVQKVFDYSQPDLQYTFDSNNTVWEFSVKSKAAALWSSIYTFLLLGIKHILIGYDHILFLVALIVIGLSTREAIKIITSFTVAHSITLLLAAMQIVTLNSKFVESVIALSICYVALENLLAKQINYRWLATFIFGLIHGFGFASVLQEFIAGKTNLVLSVVSFNVGVELGQLMVLLIILPVLQLMRKKLDLRRITIIASAVIFVLGLIWLVERVFNLQLVPF